MPSMSGKSEFALNLIKYRECVYDKEFKRILYCIPEKNHHLYADFLKRLKDACSFCEVIFGLPDPDSLNLTSDKTSKLVIIDDLATSALQSSAMLQVNKKYILRINYF